MKSWYKALILIIPLLITGCMQESRKEEMSSVQPEEIPDSQKEMIEAPEEMLSSFSVSGYAKGGKKQWELEGKSADIATENINLIDVIGRVYGKDTNMTIVADQGSLNRINDNVHLEKNVLVTTDEGATLTADYLDWDAQNEKLTSDAPVQIKRGEMRASGQGIIAQPALNLVELKKDVTVEIFLESRAESVTDKQNSVSLPLKEEAPTTVITCDGLLEVDYQSNLAIFQNNVKVEDSRGEIFADKMDVYFATQTESGKELPGMQGLGIERIVSTGNVEIHQGENITYSQKAVYDAKTGKLTLTGQPKLVIYSTEGFSQLMGSSKTDTEEEAGH